MFRTLISRTLAGVAVAAMTAGAALAQSGEPIKIGFSMALTGPLAANGKQALLGAKIWEEDTNKKGGLNGRQVKLVYYDDQSNPSTVPGIYTKLLDVDKVDLVVGPYATAMIAPAMPVVIPKNKTFISLFGLAVNEKFKYPRYFSMIPTGQDTKPSFTEGLFQVAVKQNPKPQTVALAWSDLEFSKNACEGARENIKRNNLKIIYDKSYPGNTTDFTPIVRAVQAANPDIFVICSYPLDSVGMVNSINELGYKPKMVGGAMVGLQATVFKTRLGPTLNGIVNYETWVPSQANAATNEFLKVYPSKAGAEGVDPLGYYLGTWGYAYLEVLGEAVKATKSIDDAKLADWLSKNTIKTILGDIKFGKGGEWAEGRVLTMQFQNIKSNALDEFKDMKKQPILAPANLKSGEIVYPFAEARK